MLIEKSRMSISYAQTARGQVCVLVETK